MTKVASEQWQCARFMENVTSAFSIPSRCLKYVAIFDSVTVHIYYKYVVVLTMQLMRTLVECRIGSRA